MNKINLILLFLCTIVKVSGQTPDDKTKIADRDKYLFAAKTESKKFAETVPFTVSNNLMFVAVQIDGKKYNFLFDTGAVTMVSKELLEKFAFKEVMQNKLVDGSGETKVEKFYMIKQLRLGNVTFENIGAASMDLKKMSAQFCMPIDGIIGANLMRNFYWKFDYRNKSIVFSDRKIKPAEKSYDLEFQEDFSGTPLIKLFFKQYNFLAIFDTGNNKGFNLPDSLYFKSGYSKDIVLRRGSGNTEFTLFGNKAVVNHASILDSITLGTRLFKNQPVRIGPSPLPILGNKFLMNFDEVVIDWQSSVIHLPEQYRSEEPLKTLGFDPLFTDGKIVVSYIWDGSDAQKQGLELGDAIIAIDGRSVDAVTQEQWCTLREAVKDQSTLKFKVRKKDGSEKFYELNRYILLD